MSTTETWSWEGVDCLGRIDKEDEEDLCFMLKCSLIVQSSSVKL